MSLDKVGISNTSVLVEDKVVKQTPQTSPIPSTEENKIQSKSDQIGIQNNSAVQKTSKPAIKSNLQVDVQDKDGFLINSKDDLSVKVSGEINISKDFILEQLSKMKSNQEKEFYAPKFDSERKQYVISGKAFDALLGMINVRFEIRLGDVDGNLAFNVDNFIKRGSIYSDLSDMLKEEGIQTYKKDKKLFITPTYTNPIDIPISKEKSQTGRIEKIDTNSQNTKITIDKYGNVKVTLKDVKIDLSSDIAKPETKSNGQNKSDVASIKFDFSMDNKLKPTAEIKSGSVNANLSKEELSSLIGEKTAKAIAENIGEKLSVGISDLKGKVNITDKGVNVDTDSNVTVKSDSGSNISMNLDADYQNNTPDINSKNVDIKLKNGQTLKADKVIYEDKANGFNIKAQNANAKVSLENNTVEVSQANLNISKEGENIKANVKGSLNADINQKGIKAKVNSSGEHNISVSGNKISVSVENADVVADYDATAVDKSKDPKSTKETKSNTEIDFKVKNANISGQAKTGFANFSGSVKNGSIEVKAGKDISIKSDAEVNIEATGDKVKGKTNFKGVTSKINSDGTISAKVTNSNTTGSFSNPTNKLGVAGNITGDFSVNVADGKTEVKTVGTFDANFEKKDKINVKGKGGNASFKIDEKENINLELNNFDASTQFKSETVKVKADSKGQQVNIDVVGDDISILTKNTKSKADIKVKEVFRGVGTTGDVALKVKSGKIGDDVDIKVKNADIDGHVKNKNGRLNITANVKGNADVNIDQNSNVRVGVKKAQTQAKVTLDGVNQNRKIDVNAKGNDFTLSVIDDDIDINLKNTSFNGSITPNQKIGVKIGTEKSSDLKVHVKDVTDTQVEIETKAPVKGNVSINKKIDSDFNNDKGFKVSVIDEEKSTKVKTELQNLNIKGGVNTEGAKIGIDGKGNFTLDLNDITDGGTDVKVNYDGKITGTTDVKNTVVGNYGLDGKLNVNVSGDDDIDVSTQGKITGNLSSPKFGISSDLNVNGTKDNIRVSIRNENINVDIKEAGFVQLKDINKLNIGDPQVTEILNKLELNSSKIMYKDLSISNSAENVSVKVKSEGIKTRYGNVDISLTVDKKGDSTNIKDGAAILEPNKQLYDLIKDELEKKYNIKMLATPELKNGTFSIQGEIRSKTGTVQIADFNIKTQVNSKNELVLELDKAKVLKVVGSGTVRNVLNNVLDKAGIDTFRNNKETITISLSDITKDLKTTQGVNFTGLKIVENKIVVGFEFDSLDQKISQLAKNKDLNGLKSFISSVGYKKLSAEALSTSYETFVKEKDINSSSKMLVDLSKLNAKEKSTNISKALDWISKNATADKKYIDDDIVLSFAKNINLDSEQGKSIIRNLPKNVVQNLANSLDITLSQGGGFSLISSEERQIANKMRSLVGLPLNNKSF